MISPRTHRFSRFQCIATGRAIAWAIACGCASGVTQAAPPNVVIVFTDDQGWGDLSCQGSTEIPTPNIDRLAEEGMRFTDFYASQPVCSASRASLLTGCYANRLGIRGALVPSTRHGVDPDETTIADALKPLGYSTACFGKWHLGHLDPFLPTAQGFDEYYGIPYSNDMWPGHPESPKAWPRLPIYAGDSLSGCKPVDFIDDLDGQDRITRELTTRAVDFIERNSTSPFFLYLPHSMPHVPLGAGPAFRQSTDFGPYGDVIREIDWSVGRIRAELERQGVLDRTIFIFTSDNGPWLNYGDHAGTTGGLREGKGTTFEGGVRVPMVVRYPPLVPPASICENPAMMIDILPTLIEITGAEAPARKIDGRSILPLWRGDAEAEDPHEAMFFWYRKDELQAMRMGRWKMHFPHVYRSLEGRPPGNNGRPAKYTYGIKIEQSLYDLEEDPAESRNIIADHPEVVERMNALADDARRRLGDTLTKAIGSEVRPSRVVRRESDSESER
ncbi:MAG: arylsulfatase [Phycisphaerae bacterium]|nr:arylsulfatase [Phycisphaerae bacterium]